jgi:protein-disulfide isomerase
VVVDIKKIVDNESPKKDSERYMESPFYGFSGSNVQLTIFSDYECPACIYFEKTI